MIIIEGEEICKWEIGEVYRNYIILFIFLIIIFYLFREFWIICEFVRKLLGKENINKYDWKLLILFFM